MNELRVYGELSARDPPARADLALGLAGVVFQIRICKRIAHGFRTDLIHLVCIIVQYEARMVAG